MATRHEPMTVLAPMQIGAAAVTVIAASFLGHPVWNPGADTLELGLLGLMGVGTILTFLCSLKASELAPASKVGLMGYLAGLFAADLFATRASFLIVAGGLIWFLAGTSAAAAALTPLLFLLLAIPLPEIVVTSLTSHVDT